MKIALEWDRALKLRDGQRESLIYTLNLEGLPRAPGIYVFGRKWGRNFEALYVGKANNIRGRVKGQLNNVRLMQSMKGARQGKRIVFAGTIRTKRGQRLGKVLAVAERAFIRHLLAEGHDLVNKQGARMRRHEVSSVGEQPKRFIPSLMYLEKAKGE